MEDRLLLTRRQAAELLGVKPDVLWRWTHASVLPNGAVLRVGRKLWYRRAALEAWARGDQAREVETQEGP